MPGRHVELEPVQHLRELGAVAEADVLEVDAPLDPRQLERAGRVDDLRLLVEHADDLVQRRDRGEERVVELRELLDRVEEVREVEREGEERAGGHVAVVDEPAAVAEDDRRRGRREQVDGGEVDRVQDGRLVVRGAVAVVDAVERLLLHRLARERLDDAHARDVLRERGRDEAEPLADAAVGAVRAAAEPGGHERHRDEHRQRREREPPVEEEEDDGGAEQEQRVLDQARDAVGDELVERLDVVRDPADDHAGAVALVEAEREPLQVRRRACCAGRRGRARRPSRSDRCWRTERASASTAAARKRTTIYVSRPRSPGRIPSSIASFARYGGASATSV